MELNTRDGLARGDASAPTKKKDDDEADIVRVAYRRALLLHSPATEGPMLMHDSGAAPGMDARRGAFLLLFGVVNWRFPSTGAF
jgi:hypothetical protein